MRAFVFFFLIGLLSSNVACSQTTATKSQLKKETFKVYGNCLMCQNTIQGVAKASGAKTAEWNMQTDMLTVQFDPSKVSLKQIQTNIAGVGYDNDGCRGGDEAYARLPACCQYDRKPKE